MEWVSFCRQTLPDQTAPRGIEVRRIANGEFRHSVFDRYGTEQVETFHATLPDALRAAANSMDAYGWESFTVVDSHQG